MSCYVENPPQKINVTDRKSSISCKCCECGETIEPGTVYEYVSAMWDGDHGVYETCIICTLIRDDLTPCFVYGTLRETIMQDYGIDINDECDMGEEP